MDEITYLRNLRESGLRAPTYRDELHYSDKYGMTLSDAQVKALDQEQEQFQSKIQEAKATAVTPEKKYWLDENNNPISTEKFKEKLDNFYTSGLVPTFDEAMSEWKKNAIMIQPFKDGTGYDPFYLDPEAAKKFLQAANEPGYYGIKQIDDKTWHIDLQDYGAEILNPLKEYTDTVYQKFGEEYMSATNDVFNAYLNDYESAIQNKSPVITPLSTAQGQIEQEEQLNTAALNAIRLKYQEKLAGMKETIGGLINNG